jgi:NADH dehydrogenase
MKMAVNLIALAVAASVLIFPAGTQALLSIRTTKTTYRPIQDGIHAASCRSIFRLQSQKSNTYDSCDCAIFGGGFGGLYTALELSRAVSAARRKLDIVLVEPTETFVFLPLLYDFTVGTATELEVCPSYRDLLQGTNIRHVRASLESLQCISRNSTTPPSYATATLKAMPGTGKEGNDTSTLNFRTGVVAVGARPMLETVPGASEYAQPFYTADDAKRTRRLLNRLEEDCEQHVSSPSCSPQIAIIGGGYGGVELSASIQRRLQQKNANVWLFSRNPPMAGTRAEAFVDRALRKLGVKTQLCSVKSIEKTPDDKFVVKRELNNEEVSSEFDAVLWTAGSGPAKPVPDACHGLKISATGRLATDSTLRCLSLTTTATSPSQPRIWALGDCSEIDTSFSSNGEPKLPTVPKTAQAAMQQAEVVAHNVLRQFVDSTQCRSEKQFQYQDLGSMLTLGGPNGAILAPREGSTLAPVLSPLLSTMDEALSIGDQLFRSTVYTTMEKMGGISPDILGLSLGSHGLGASPDSSDRRGSNSRINTGTLAGTIGGAARRAVYAIRMPTPQQRTVSFVSAAIATAAALAKEAAAAASSSSSSSLSSLDDEAR